MLIKVHNYYLADQLKFLKLLFWFLTWWMTIPFQNAHKQPFIKFCLDLVLLEGLDKFIDSFRSSIVFVDVQVWIEAVLIFRHPEPVSLVGEEIPLVLS